MAFSFSKILLLTYLTFVTLFATHYGLTFCLFMGTLYDTTLVPTLFLQTYTITVQPDLMPKSLNELLRHWRSGFRCCTGFLEHCFWALAVYTQKTINETFRNNYSSPYFCVFCLVVAEIEFDAFSLKIWHLLAPILRSSTSRFYVQTDLNTSKIRHKNYAFPW